jgi:hypothetical protein
VSVKHYRDHLRTAKLDPERRRIQKLLDEELAKQRDAGEDRSLTAGDISEQSV